jgi:hypothetical protein
MPSRGSGTAAYGTWDEEGDGSEVLGSGWGTDPAEAVIRAVGNKNRFEEEMAEAKRLDDEEYQEWLKNKGGA